MRGLSYEAYHKGPSRNVPADQKIQPVGLREIILTIVGEQLKLLTDTEKPDWFSYPDAFRRFAESGISRFPPWRFLEPEFVLNRMNGLRQRSDRDDVASWERGRGAVVVIVHNFADPGWEQVGEFENFWSWFRSAVDDFATFEDD